MKKPNITITCVFIFIQSCVCRVDQPTSNACSGHENEIDNLSALLNLIGDSLSIIDGFENSYVIKDTVFQAEDETTWPGKIIGDTNGPLVLIESSWQDNARIASITVISNEIILSNGVRVGQSMNDVLRSGDSELISSVDGLLIVRLFDHPELSFIARITNDSLIYNLYNESKQLPDTLLIDWAVIR